MQFPSDADLAEAIASARISVQPLLEFDWARDGTFSSTSYANQSSIVASVDIDFASLHSDLPSDINTVVGSSSAEMKVVLNGLDGMSGLHASQLWSEYYVPSPLYNTLKKGVPVRYSRVVQTKSGKRTIRQFTGWVKEYLLDEESDTVSLTCSDVYDLQTSLVSLPVWARGPDASISNTPGPSGKVSSMMCIDAAWVYKDVLRQSGRSLWPVIRDDAVLFWSCDGSLLPSRGEIGCALNVPGVQFLTTTTGDDFLPFVISNAPYGLSISSSGGTANDDLNVGFARASTMCNVPDRGSSTPGTFYIAMGGWFQSYGGTPGATGNPSTVQFLLGSLGTDAGYLILSVYPTGSFSIGIHESGSSGSSNAGTTRTYSWVSAGNSMPAGWHYLEVWMTFTNSAINAGAYIDGVSKVQTASPASTAAFKYYLNVTLEEETNQGQIFARDVVMQHVWTAWGSGAFPVSGSKKDPPYVTAGKPRPARTSQSTNWLTHIPDRYNKYGWDILKEAVEGELGVMLTREDGSVWIMGRDDAFFYGWLPSVGGDFSQVITQAIELGLTLSWFGVNQDLLPDPAQDLTRAKISGLQYNPSADTYRNAIAYHVDQTKAINDIVWSSNDPTQFYSASGSTNLSKTVGLPSGTISIYNHTVDVGITATANKPPLDQTSISAVQASAPTFAAVSGWLATTFWLTGQRQFRVGYGAGLLSPGDVYVGAASGADQANFQIGGWKYDSSDPYDEIWYTVAEVAAKGAFLLDLGSNDWRQYPPKLRKIFNGLLRDTVRPAPVLRNLSVPLDPRRQLLDVVRLPPSRIVSGDVYAQIVGKRISDTQDSAQDYLDVRVVGGPSNTSFWDVSNWDTATWSL